VIFGETLAGTVDDLLDAVARQDVERYYATLDQVATATRQAAPAEVQEAIARLLPVLADIPLGVGADLAPLVGGMAEFGTDPTAALPVQVSRAALALELAARFADLVGDPPAADDGALIEPFLAEFVPAGPRYGLSEQEAQQLGEAWFTSNAWTQPVLYLAQRQDVRAVLPERERLLAATAAVAGHIEAAQWLHGLLLVLDDTPVTVLHRATGRAFRVRISGVGDNFQLHTLLAAHLIGAGRLPGVPPTPAEIEAATDGDPMPAGGIGGRFNLVAADGSWIWNEGRPADIPAHGGHRVVVLDPPPYERTWNAGRVYPLMKPGLVVEGELGAGEAAELAAWVKPAA
jgi:hypothetical protein